MASDIDILKNAVQCLEEGKRLVLCTIIDKKGSGPRDIGGKMVIYENGEAFGTIGGGNLERALIEESLKALKEGKSRKVVFSLNAGETRKEVVETGLICGGEITIFLDVIEPKPRLFIVGAGHVALPLAKIAKITGFNITIVDDDVKLANKERFPMADEIVTGDFNEILNRISVGKLDFVIIAHGEPEHDYLALKQIVKKTPAYIGLLGSKKKAATLTNKLKEAGITDEKLKNLHAPVGLDIGAQTPEEIAVSIIAEIISSKRKQAI
jgi:xanthine dehydrogenase accessory factor